MGKTRKAIKKIECNLNKEKNKKLSSKSILNNIIAQQKPIKNNIVKIKIVDKNNNITYRGFLGQKEDAEKYIIKLKKQDLCFKRQNKYYII